MRDTDKKYLMTHPLIFEVLYILSESGEATSTQIAKRLNRGLSTIWDSLQNIEKNTDLIRSSKLSNDKRNTVFSLLNLEDVKSTLDDDKVLKAYARNSSRLRTIPKILMDIFESTLADQLEEYEPKRGLFVKTTLPVEYIIPIFLLKTPFGEQYIDVVRIRRKEVIRIHESLGKIIDLMLGPTEPKRILIVYLFSASTSRAYEESVQQIVDGMNIYGIELKTIVEFIDDEDLIDPYFIRKLSKKISDKILV